jgi:heme exporter protein C
MANVPFVYVSVNVWRTLHPKTTVIPSLQPGMREVFWFCVASFAVLYGVLLALRVRLAAQQAEVERLYLELDDQSELS